MCTYPVGTGTAIMSNNNENQSTKISICRNSGKKLKWGPGSGGHLVRCSIVVLFRAEHVYFLKNACIENLVTGSFLKDMTEFLENALKVSFSRH